MINQKYNKQYNDYQKEIEKLMDRAATTRDNRLVLKANSLIDKQNRIVGLIDPAFGPKGHYGAYI